MNLQEAIKINAEHAIVEDEAGNHNLAKALRLGKEALKRHKLNKTRDYPMVYSLLLGETKE